MEGPASTRVSIPRRFIGHLRRTLLAGALVAVPLVATYWVLRLLFELTDGVLRPLLEGALGRRIPGLGIIVLLVLLYLLGLIARNVLGRRAIQLVQQALLRVPLVSTVYGALKSLVEALFGLPGAPTMPRRVVLVEYPGPSLWTVGFLTGMTINEAGDRLAIVYIPTAPSPQTGWVALIPVERVYETDLSVQAAMRLVLSGGVLSPQRIASRPLALP